MSLKKKTQNYNEHKQETNTGNRLTDWMGDHIVMSTLNVTIWKLLHTKTNKRNWICGKAYIKWNGIEIFTANSILRCSGDGIHMELGRKTEKVVHWTVKMWNIAKKIENWKMYDQETFKWLTSS